jgi:hypothetical protein
MKYDKQLRKGAKERGEGLITVHVQFPDGSQETFQASGTAQRCRLARWIGLLFQGVPPEKQVPEVENLVREALGEPPPPGS